MVDDEGEHDKEDGWKRTGIWTGFMVSDFGGWAKESRSPTPITAESNTRTREERWSTLASKGIMLDKARVIFGLFYRFVSVLTRFGLVLVRCLGGVD